MTLDKAIKLVERAKEEFGYDNSEAIFYVSMTYADEITTSVIDELWKLF
jgi:hypothetical protein